MAADDNYDGPVLSHHIELSPRELILIGLIVAQWGNLEYEIFIQTLKCFENHGPGRLPKALNNLQFSQVLDLWEQHVVEKAEGERCDVFREQLSEIRHLADYRNALVHGMWDWSADKLDTITAIRIRKKEILSTQFTADDLQHFAKSLGVINFRIRYPMGVKDFAAAVAQDGGYMGRVSTAQLSGHPIAEELTHPLRRHPIKPSS